MALIILCTILNDITYYKTDLSIMEDFMVFIAFFFQEKRALERKLSEYEEELKVRAM